MRKSFFIAVVTAFTFIACNNNKQENHEHNADGSHPATEGTHQHEDGSTHSDHADDVKQESFTVEQDSTNVESKNEEAHDHSH
ncbi:MAG: hypothetical protein ACK5IC_06125 [Moheibacter sp.]